MQPNEQFKGWGWGEAGGRRGGMGEGGGWGDEW